MGKRLQFTTIALAIIIATIIQIQMAHAATKAECLRKSHSHLGFKSPPALCPVVGCPALGCFVLERHAGQLE